MDYTQPEKICIQVAYLILCKSTAYFFYTVKK